MVINTKDHKGQCGFQCHGLSSWSWPSCSLEVCHVCDIVCSFCPCQVDMFEVMCLSWLSPIILFELSPPHPLSDFSGLRLTGTTDSPCELSDYPMPSEDDIQFILKEIRNYLSPDVEGKSALSWKTLWGCVYFDVVDIAQITPRITVIYYLCGRLGIKNKIYID